MTAQAPISVSVDLLAAFCKAAGDSLRLTILRVLANDSFGVLELAKILATGQSGISHHLKVLSQAGLVATRREGNAIFYRRNLSQSAFAAQTLHAALLEEVDQLTLDADVLTRIKEVHQQRAAASEAFFARIAHDFKAQQDLIASLEHYRESLLSVLDALPLSAMHSAVEVGPGDGAFLPELAKRFGHVTAIDNSPQMLDLARSRCESEALTNVELVLADALTADAFAADCVVLNMVLHHFAAPADALKQLAKIIKPGGSLLLTELCPHNQSWAKEACGDLWLGFEQDDLALWATAAGLTPSQSIYVGLKNGFQIQVRQFVRPESLSAHR